MMYNIGRYEPSRPRDGEKHKELRMIGFYNYTVILTYVSLLVSTVGTFLAVNGRPMEAVFCLMISGICDMFDGAIARTRKRTEEEKRFGIQIDSLSDLVCFGVLPAVIGVTLAATPTEEGIAWVTGGALVLCGLIRLAFFNVTEETRQSTETGRRTHFLGFPITTSAVVFPFAYAMSLLLPAALAPWAYPAFLGLTALFFIVPVKVRKVHGFGFVAIGLLGVAEAALLLLLRFGVL